MSEDFVHLKQHAEEVKRRHDKRNLQNDEMEKIYWMEWDEETLVKRQFGKSSKLTKSPRGRISIQGMVRLLCASDPLFSIPKDINNPNPNIEKIERFCKGLWVAASKVYGQPLHYEVLRSATIWSEIHMLLTSTQDLLKASKGTSREMRAEEVAERTPFLVTPVHPSSGFPEWDQLGLCFYYSYKKMLVRDLLNDFPDAEAKLVKKGWENDLYRQIDRHDCYDLKNRWVWIDGLDDEPIFEGPHGLPFIPVSVTTVEGSRLFSEEEKRREPMLYSLWKSGLLNRQNLLLTTMFTMIFAMGANPMFVEYLLNPENPPRADFSKPGGVIRYRAGERRDVLAKQVIDPSLMQGWQLSTELEMESTIYRQTLGEPLGANAPYSMVALLSQSGRLPLLIPQRMSSVAIADVVEKALKWMRVEKTKGVVSTSGIKAILSGKDVPKQFEIEAKLDIALPQDRLTNVNAAVMGTQGDNPLFTVEWAQENLLQIAQPDQMRREIWTEKVSGLFYQKFVTDMMAALAQSQQAAMAPAGQSASGMPGTEAPMQPGPQTPQGMGTPELAQPTEPFPNMQSPYEPYPPMGPGPDTENMGMP